MIWLIMVDVMMNHYRLLCHSHDDENLNLGFCFLCMQLVPPLATDSQQEVTKNKKSLSAARCHEVMTMKFW